MTKSGKKLAQVTRVVLTTSWTPSVIGHPFAPCDFVIVCGFHASVCDRRLGRYRLRGSMMGLNAASRTAFLGGTGVTFIVRFRRRCSRSHYRAGCFLREPWVPKLSKPRVKPLNGVW